LEHVEEPEKMLTCKGLQEGIGHKCLFKGEGLSEERVEELCGCREIYFCSAS